MLVSAAVPEPEVNPRGFAEACAALGDDLGWALGAFFRSYRDNAKLAFEELPGGPRGYQVLRFAVEESAATQLAIAQQLGIDRTVMTYLLDDLEAADLVARQPDPLDRRSRRVAATEHGRQVLADLGTRFCHAEQRLLAGLAPDAQPVFRKNAFEPLVGVQRGLSMTQSKQRVQARVAHARVRGAIETPRAETSRVQRDQTLFFALAQLSLA